jgi:outer membrane protein TolC
MAVDAAELALRITRNQYKAGIVNYIDVVITQASTLANESALVDIRGRQMAASVALIQALGGGWNADELPTGPALAAY